MLRQAFSLLWNHGGSRHRLPALSAMGVARRPLYVWRPLLLRVSYGACFRRLPAWRFLGTFPGCFPFGVWGDGGGDLPRRVASRPEYQSGATGRGVERGVMGISMLSMPLRTLQ